MATEADLSQLKPQEWDQLLEMTNQLEETWRVSGNANLLSLLPQVRPGLRRAFLVELVKTELEIRYRNNKPLTLEGYTKHYPELGGMHALPPELIYEEYRVRQLYGDRPSLTSYRERFPQQFPEIRRLSASQPIGTIKNPSHPIPQDPNAAGSTRLHRGTEEQPRNPADSAQSSLPPTNDQLPVSEGYTLLEKIGAGQFGEVYRARAPGGIEVAVKRIFRTLDSESGRREKQALELMTRLNHPFLLQMHSYWSMEDRLYIVMELAEDSLQDWARSCRKQGMVGIPAEKLLSYFAEAGEALDYLHSHNVVHRDIKPANMLRIKGHAKVADFGLARLQENRQVADATFCGTPVYMPPEMWKSQVSIHSDQYSLALAYIELCMGRRPFSGKDQFELARQHLMGAPDLEGFNKAEQKVLLRALAKDPDQRHGSCVAFIEALKEAHEPFPPRDPPPRPPKPMIWRLLSMVLAVLVALGGAAVVYYLFPKPNPPVEPPPPWLPPGFAKAENTRIVRGYYHQILCPLDGADSLVFVLIPREGPDDPATFYMMKNLVTNQQYQVVLKQKRMQEEIKRFRVESKKWEEMRRGPNWSKLPVTYVSAVEAHCFAQAVGGHIPNGRQWDKAGGRFDEAKGPYRPNYKPGEIILLDEGRTRPEPAGSARGDVSMFQIHDMAGNCREFTRDRFPGPGPFQFANAKKDDRVALRGHSFEYEQPFKFELLADEVSYPESIEYREPRHDISFRMVMELPAEK